MKHMHKLISETIFY